MWNFSSSFQLDISLVSAANEWDIEWTREERFDISKQPCITFFIRIYEQKEVDLIHVSKGELALVIHGGK